MYRGRKTISQNIQIYPLIRGRHFLTFSPFNLKSKAAPVSNHPSIDNCEIWKKKLLRVLKHYFPEKKFTQPKDQLVKYYGAMHYLSFSVVKSHGSRVLVLNNLLGMTKLSARCRDSSPLTTNAIVWQLRLFCVVLPRSGQVFTAFHKSWQNMYFSKQTGTKNGQGEPFRQQSQGGSFSGSPLYNHIDNLHKRNTIIG